MGKCKKKTTLGINNIFKELNRKKLTLNIKKSNFIAFSIYNTIIPFNDFVIHTCNTLDVNSNNCNCQHIIRVTRVK